MTQQDRPAPAGTLFDLFYPVGHLVAVLPGTASAERAVAALKRAGVDDVQTWAGEQVTRDDPAFQEKRTLGRQAGAKFDAAAERAATNEYIDAAARGHSLLLARLPQERAAAAAQTLAGEHAYAVRYYGYDGITVLA